MFDLIIVSYDQTRAEESCEARDFYTSELFQKSREFAELNGADWMIASAKFGLVSPLSIIGPYDQRLELLYADELDYFRGSCRLTLAYWLAEWRKSVAHNPHVFPAVAILAGERYSQELILTTWLKSIEFRLCVPLADKTTAERLRWLDRANLESRRQIAEAKELVV